MRARPLLPPLLLALLAVAGVGHCSPPSAESAAAGEPDVSASPDTNPEGHQATTLNLEHALSSDGPFTPRGLITFTPTSLIGSYSPVQPSSSTPPQASQSPSSSRSPHDLYRIRLSDGTRTASASVPWSVLRQGRGLEYLRVHVDTTGRFYAVDYRFDLNAGEKLHKKDNLDGDELIMANSLPVMIEIVRPVAGSTPRLIQQAPKPVGSAEKGNTPVAEEQSFFRQYAIYIIPLMLYILISGGGRQEPEAESSEKRGDGGAVAERAAGAAGANGGIGGGGGGAGGVARRRQPRRR